jgi:hypothetical protein
MRLWAVGGGIIIQGGHCLFEFDERVGDWAEGDGGNECLKLSSMIAGHGRRRKVGIGN